MCVIVKQKSDHLVLESYIDPLITDSLVSDALRIKQILINLVGQLLVPAACSPNQSCLFLPNSLPLFSSLSANAIKFTESGSIMIEVMLIEARVIRFSVRDTGIGITDD